MAAKFPCMVDSMRIQPMVVRDDWEVKMSLKGVVAKLVAHQRSQSEAT